MVYQATRRKLTSSSHSVATGRKKLEHRSTELHYIVLVAAFLSFFVLIEGQAHGRHAQAENATSHSSPHSPPPSAAENITLPLANVTLVNITIYDQHAGWLDVGTDVYFRCEGEEKRFLPEVKDLRQVYQYTGQEPFQPLTMLQADKCKKCGVYEKDTWSSDDIFAEWDLCIHNFTSRAGLYHVFFENQFAAVFSCPECLKIQDTNLGRHGGTSSTSLWLILLTIAGGLSLMGIGGLGLLWLKQRHARNVHQEEAAKFMVLSDDEDNLELEMGNRRL